MEFLCSFNLDLKYGIFANLFFFPSFSFRREQEKKNVWVFVGINKRNRLTMNIFCFSASFFFFVHFRWTSVYRRTDSH